MLDCLQKHKSAVTITQQHDSLELIARQQLNPQDWEKVSAVLSILTPILYCTKAGEGDNVAVSEVIPLLKKLNMELESVPGTGVQTLKKAVLSEIKLYFVTKYGVEARKEYAVATILDPRFKLAGFQHRENSQIAKLMVLTELQLVASSGGMQDPDTSFQAGTNTNNSGWDKVFDDNGTSQDEEELEDTLRSAVSTANYGPIRVRRCPPPRCS